MKYDNKFLSALLRQDFSSFIGKVFHTINPGAKYYHNWHIDLIAAYLEEVRKGNIKRLIINIPPRTLKSVCVSVAWPAWLLGQNSALRVIVSSYSGMLSVKHSLDCKLIITSSWYRRLFPKTIISSRHNQKSKFLTDQNGFRFASSVGGSVTGEGGDILIIDDPHNPTQINSVKIRNKAIEWFEQTFVTRLNDKNTGEIVLVMQRLHEQDLAGHLLAGNGWDVLKIPAIAPENLEYRIHNKYYYFKQNELLNCRQDNHELLNKMEAEIGVRNFSAQYLQLPLSDSYNLLSGDDISYYYKLPDKIDYYVISWDTAIKISDQADYTVGTVWAVEAEIFYLVNLIRQKLTYPMLKEEIQKQQERYKPKHLLIEDKASGQQIIQDLKLEGYNNIQPIKTRTDKVTRFASVVPIFQSGKVLIANKSGYKTTLLKELTSFPGSKHDDIVDSVSQFLNFMKEVKTPVQPRVRFLMR